MQVCWLLVFDLLFSSPFLTFRSPHVVKYYGSYFKNTDLWIVMEYCGAGSVSDIIRLRNKTVRPFPFECMSGKYGCPWFKETEQFEHDSRDVQCLTQPLAITWVAVPLFL